MKAMKRFVTAAALVGMAVACGDEGPNGNGGVTVADLAGTWTASRFEYAPVADPTQALDLITTAGGSVSITVAADGSYDASLVYALGQPAVPFSGTISISGTTITLAVSDTVTAGPIELLPSEPFVFDTFTLSGNLLTLSASDVEFDFTLQGNPEVPATLVMVLNRT